MEEVRSSVDFEKKERMLFSPKGSDSSGKNMRYNIFASINFDVGPDLFMVDACDSRVDAGERELLVIPSFNTLDW